MMKLPNGETQKNIAKSEGTPILTREDVLEFLKNHRHTLKSDYHITKIGLIGSFARGEQTENSDIDLLIEFEPKTDDIFENKRRLRDLVKTSFDRDVDICREKYIKPYFKNYLLKDVICV